jgi:ATP-binding cassette subfamily B protein
MSIVRLFAGQKFETNNIKNWTNEVMTAERNFDWMLIKLFAFQSFSFFIMQTITLVYLIYARSMNHITVGDFALVFTINISIVDTLWNLGRQFITFSEQLGKVTQGLRITMNKPEITDHAKATNLIVHHGKIEFKAVTFCYHHESCLFDKLSVSIEPGQKVGLVGYSGSGKTTFVNLILRLFDINTGKIVIDEQNIAEVTQSSLRKQISLIPQDPTLFHRTLLENISYGKEATIEEVIRAAKDAHAHEFIERLPQGYDTMVGERGIKLSGGQRQRIAIARAILKNSPILILDEATSALDSVTEQLIQESLLKLMQNKTTLVIAHRLSTLLHMDRILVFDQGKIVEDGSHNELISLNGLYAKLWRSQIEGFLPSSSLL